MKKDKSTVVDNRVDSRNNLDVAKALKLRIFSNLSYGEIGKQCGVSKQAVHRALKPFLDMIGDPQALTAYRENRVNIFDAVERKLISNIVDEERLKKASVNNLAYATKQFNDMSRLERGLSTENIGIAARLSDPDREVFRKIAEEFSKKKLAAIRAEVG